MYHAIRIDMRLTDDHIFNILKSKFGHRPGEITLKEIAREAGCAVDTVFNSIRRLEHAGRLRTEYRGPAKSCIYQVLE
jgi:DNA-binding Lrp family transcriptional regulator